MISGFRLLPSSWFHRHPHTMEAAVLRGFTWLLTVQSASGSQEASPAVRAAVECECVKLLRPWPGTYTTSSWGLFVVFSMPRAEPTQGLVDALPVLVH